MIDTVKPRAIGRALLASAACTALVTVASCSSGGSAGTGSAPAVSVEGNRLVDGSGHTLVLAGVTRQDTEYSCTEQGQVFGEPAGPASLAPLTRMHANVLRLLLNEDCWLGINGVAPSAGGSVYRNAIEKYVTQAHAAGLDVILALGRVAPNGQESSSAKAQFMADANHAPEFWTSVATAFVGDKAVLFDLFSAPYDVSWDCWAKGCLTPIRWQASGMQALVDAVRNAGAAQPIVLTGLDEGNDLSGWFAHAPKDPDGSLVAGYHVFDIYNCARESCWTADIGPVAAKVPVIATEVGSYACSPAVPTAFYAWARAHAVSYLGAYWNSGQCVQGESLLEGSPGALSVLGTALAHSIP